MNRLEYIKLLKKTLGNIIDSTVSTIEKLENTSDFEFENNIIEYIDNMPFPPAVKEHIQRLEECNKSQASLLLIKTEQAKSLSSQLFVAKAAVKKQKALHKEDVETLTIQITDLINSLKETKEVAANSYLGLKKVESLVNNILHE